MTNPNPLTSAVETQLSITSSFQLWLNRQLEKNPSHGELISKIESRLVSYRERLSKFNTTHIGTHSLNESEPWTITIEPQKATGDDKTIRIPITGPGANDYSEIIAKDEQEARYITGVCSQLLPKNQKEKQLIRLTSQDQYLGYIKRIVRISHYPIKSMYYIHTYPTFSIPTQSSNLYPKQKGTSSP